MARLDRSDAIEAARITAHREAREHLAAGRTTSALAAGTRAYEARTGRTRAAHPAVQVERINDVREANRNRNAAARQLEKAEHDLLASVDRAQRSGVTYEVLADEITDEVARTSSTLRRKVAAHRTRYPALPGMDR